LYNFNVCSTICCIENSCSAINLLFFPILVSNFGLLINFWIAIDNSFASFAGTRKPFSPSFTTSRQPGTSVVTIARPTAAASIKDFGSPSRYDGSTAMCDSANSWAISALSPSHLTTPDLFHCSSCFADIDSGLPGSTDPTKRKSASIPCCLLLLRLKILANLHDTMEVLQCVIQLIAGQYLLVLQAT